MATLREIRGRISSVKSTQKITKAMKMVAAAKLRRAQDAVISARPYARTMKNILRDLAAVVDVTANPLFTGRPPEKVVVVVLTSDRGLCGAFNTNIIKAAIAHIQKEYPAQHAAGNVKLACVGKKGADFFTKNGYAVEGKYAGIFAALAFGNAREITSALTTAFLEGRCDRVDIVFNEFKSIIQQQLVIDRFLPIPVGAVTATGATPVGTAAGAKPPADYIFEPSGEQLLATLVPKHLNFQMWRMLLESNAAEQGARMTAMDNATTNASDLIRDLQLSYNKARQASITKELLEIVSGAEALTNA
jgi:F-type H+-transporting ATPase subunit gamma